jgi:hypothetical protein
MIVLFMIQLVLIHKQFRELQNIYDSVYQEILIGNLSTELNRLFLTIINYIFAEQKSPDWIFKTSFIDVYHNLSVPLNNSQIT